LIIINKKNMWNNNLFEIKKIFVRIFYLLILFFCIFDFVKASNVVPGTIEKWSNSSSIQCWISSTSYVTSNWCTPAGTCHRTCDSRNQYGSCTSWSNKRSGWSSYWSSSTSYNNYLSQTSTITYNWTVKLTSDIQNCTMKTTWVSSSAQYWWYTSCSAPQCWLWWAWSRYIPKHWYCSSAISYETIISSYDQLWNRIYSKSNYPTIETNSTLNKNLTSTCYIEWRYATADNSWPSISINWVSNVFAWGNDDERCQIDKYTNYTSDPDTISYVHCNYYNNLNPNNPWAWEDLLKWLNITIWPDSSWIWKVEISLWSCNVTYNSFSNNLSTILVSTTSSSWVKGTYTNWFTLKYDESITALWKTQPSLLEEFWKDRLDKCLAEWKNNLVVKAYDMARSTYDWVTLSENSSTYTVAWYIYVDNSGPKLELIDDFTQVESNNSFYWTYSNSNGWRNYTLEWNIKQLEHYEWGDNNECDLFEFAWSCIDTLSLWDNEKYTWPIWVDETTWEYSYYECWEITIPTDLTCEIWCKEWFSMIDWRCISDTDICVWVYVWWVLAVLWETAEEIDWECIPYCVPNHSIWCIVKEEGTPVEPDPVEPDPVEPDPVEPDPVEPDPVTNWECWTSDWVTLSSAPTTNLCNSWTATSVIWTWPWTWTCEWSWWWTDAECRADIIGEENFCPWAIEDLWNGYRVVSSENTEHMAGCSADYGTYKKEKCILCIPSEKMYVAPSSSEAVKTHADCDDCYVGAWSTNWEAASYCTNLSVPLPSGTSASYWSLPPLDEGWLKTIQEYNTDYWKINHVWGTSRYWSSDYHSYYDNAYPQWWLHTIDVYNRNYNVWSSRPNVRCVAKEEIAREWWMALDSNCDIPDITVWDQVWAGCNSTLWTWISYGDSNAEPFDWSTTYKGCYDYLWDTEDYSTECYWYNTKESNYNSTYWVNNIWWKLYTFDNSDSACPTDWRHVPSEEEWKKLFNTLYWSTCVNYWSQEFHECDWIWWASSTSNNVAKVLKIPLAGRRYKDEIDNPWNLYYSKRWDSARLWNSTESGDSAAWYSNLDHGRSTVSNVVMGTDNPNGSANSVRCIKWESTESIEEATSSTPDKPICPEWWTWSSGLRDQCNYQWAWISCIDNLPDYWRNAEGGNPDYIWKLINDVSFTSPDHWTNSKGEITTCYYNSEWNGD